MDREGFRNRLKQYKEAKGFDPQLKYWEWKQKYDSAPQPDNLPSQPEPDKPTTTSSQLEDRAHRWDNGYVNTNRESFDSPYEDARYHDYRKPRFELRKGDVHYGNPKLLNAMGKFGKVLRGGSILGEVVQNLFPSEEAEAIESLRVNMQKQNDYLTGKSIPMYASGGKVGDEHYVNAVSTEENPIYYKEESAKDRYIRAVAELKAAGGWSDNLRTEIANEYSIPYLPEKEIRLTTGRYNTGKISTNLLDSIYNSAMRTGVPVDIALGLAGRESTLGIGRGFKKGQSINGTNLMSNWQQIDPDIPATKDRNKFNDIRAKILFHDNVSDDEYNFSADYIFDDINSRKRLKKIKENPIDNALKFYQSGKYNPGDKRHSQMVEEDAKILMSDPAIKKWAQEKGIAFAEGGEVGDNDFMKQFGKQVSYKPEETSWWSNVKNWWNDLTGMKNYAYGNCATTPNGKHTKECAHYSNSVLRNQGYKNIVGDAWTRAANSGMKKITSGYDGLAKPAEWDESDAHDYLQSAANNFINNVDTTALNPYDVIGLYYPDSPNTKKAFEQGRWGETQTHTGHIAVGNDGTHYVVHNVGGHLKMNKLADMLTGDYDYLPVSAYRPKK